MPLTPFHLLLKLFLRSLWLWLAAVIGWRDFRKRLVDLRLLLAFTAVSVSLVCLRFEALAAAADASELSSLNGALFYIGGALGKAAGVIAPLCLLKLLPGLTHIAGGADLLFVFSLGLLLPPRQTFLLLAGASVLLLPYLIRALRSPPANGEAAERGGPFLSLLALLCVPAALTGLV